MAGRRHPRLPVEAKGSHAQLPGDRPMNFSAPAPSGRLRPERPFLSWADSMPSRFRKLWAVTLTCATGATLSLRAQHKLGPQGSFEAPKIAAASDEGEKNLKRFQIPTGWKGELWAAEPLVAHGVAIDVADDGRVFVAESFRAWRGVPDIRGIMPWLDEDLACKSVEDRLAMMRRHLGEEGMKAYFKNTERIQVLRDTDGDGRADLSKVFAENFATPLDGVASGVLARGKDVWFANIPNVWRLRDDNLDDVADSRRSISYGHGIRVGFLGHDLHGLAWGPDGRLYFSIGDRASMLKQGSRLVGTPDSGAVFRCEPDGAGIEMVYSGLRNPQELVFDEWGDLFTGDNNSDGGDQARFTYLIEGGDSGWRIGWQFLERSDAPMPRGPWNMEKMWHPQNDAQPAYLTPPIKNITAGPSGLAYYPGTGASNQWQGTFTLCDFRGSGAGSGIWSFQLKPKGASFEIVNDQKFLWAIEATDGTWGPDGAFWVFDWVDGWEPVGKGRLYRFYDPAQSQSAVVQSTAKLLKEGFSQRAEKELLGLLGHPNFRVRQNAQFELAGRGEPMIKGLAGVVKFGKTVHARLHAAWALGQVARASRATALGARSEALEPLLPLLADADAHLRANAARVLGDARYGRAYEGLVKVTTDADPHVRALATIALGHLGRREALPALYAVLRENANQDPHLRHAAVLALSESADVDDLLAAAKDASEGVRMGVLLALRRLERSEISRFLQDDSELLVTEAARAIHDLPISGAMPDLAALIERPLNSTNRALTRRVINANLRFGTETSAAALARFASSDGDEYLRTEALASLGAWPKNSGRDRITGLWRPTAFARDTQVPAAALRPLANTLLGGAPNPVRRAVARAAGELKLESAAPALAEMVVKAQADGPARVAALNALFALGASELSAALEAGAKDADEDVRKTATKLAAQAPPVTAVNRSTPSAGAGDDRVARLVAILANGSLSEKQNALATVAGVQGAAADALLGTWLADVVAGKVPVALRLDVLDAAAKRPALKEALAKYEASLDPKDELAKWRVCLEGGNLEEGRKIFLERAEVSCVRCHKVRGEGGEVGPELTGLITRKDRAYLLQSIARPNAAIAEGFESALVTLKNGVSYAGVIKSDTADTLELNSPEDGLLQLKKSEIQAREKGLSGMPEGLVDQLSRQDLRNLIEFLASLK
jgi:quinoprotein glucose dehydrogenase